MKYTYSPARPMEQAASARRGQPQVAMRSGGVYDIDPEWAQFIVGIVPGVDGGPCLVPVDPPGAAAAADFIAAISTPTEHNPETDPTPVEPAQKKRGRPRRS